MTDTQYRLKGTAGPVINETWPLKGRVVFGSGAEADVRLEGDGIGDPHARVHIGEHGVPHLTVLGGSVRVRVNGQSVHDAALAPGDELQMGPNRWIVQAPGLKPQRVLTEEAVAPQRRWWPWAVAAVLAAGGAAAAAWWQGWLVF